MTEGQVAALAEGAVSVLSCARRSRLERTLAEDTLALVSEVRHLEEQVAEFKELLQRAPKTLTGGTIVGCARQKPTLLERVEKIEAQIFKGVL